MTVIRLFISGSLLGGLVWMVDLNDLLESLRQADPIWLAVAFLLLPVNIGLEILKWKRLLKTTSERSTMDATGSVLAGYTLGLVTPVRFGEYFGRSMYLRDHQLQTILLTGVDRVLSMIVCLAAGLLATGLIVGLGLTEPSQALVFSTVIGIAVTGILIVMVIRPSLIERMLSRLWRSERWSDELNFLKSVGFPHLWDLLGLSAARQAVFTAQLVVLVWAFGGTAGWPLLVVGATLVFFVKTLIPQITFADLGIRESTSVFFFGLLGVSAAASLNASLVLFGLNLVLPAIVGVPFATRFRLSPAKRASARARLKWSARL